MEIIKMTKEHNEKIKKDERFKFNRNVSKHMYDHEYSLVAIENDEIIGFVYAAKLMGMYSLLILAINTREDKQNQGVGKRLLNFLEKEARKRNMQDLLLFYEETPKLMKFYLDNGFEIGNNMKAIMKEL